MTSRSSWTRLAVLLLAAPCGASAQIRAVPARVAAPGFFPVPAAVFAAPAAVVAAPALTPPRMVAAPRAVPSAPGVVVRRAAAAGQKLVVAAREGFSAGRDANARFFDGQASVSRLGETNDLIDLSDLTPLLKRDEKTWTTAVSFHAHSRYSDGEFAPAELARKLHEAGLKEVALTDHDTVLGQEEFMRAARALGLSAHTGVELTGGAGIHIVVLDLDIRDATLGALLVRIQEWRLVRAKAYVKYLNAHPDFIAKGVSITIEEVLAKTVNGQIERPQIAEVLVDKGMVANKSEAFKKYIGFDIKDPEVLKLEPKPEQVMAAVRSSGGYAFLAHPYTLAKDGPTVEKLLAMGMHGIEVYRPSEGASVEQLGKNEADMARYLTFAHDLGLLVMPGADFHGPSTPHLNHLAVPMPRILAEQLLKALSLIRRLF